MIGQAAHSIRTQLRKADLVGKTKLLVVQPTAFCNIDCRYCYLPNRTSKGCLSLDNFRSVMANLERDGALAPGFELLWHAGEPLTLTPEYYRQANAFMQEAVGHLLGGQSFQTNGTLITDRWCDLFKELGASVGVSLDGPKATHDRNRVTRAGTGTFDHVVRGIETLRRNNVNFYVMAVVDKHSLADPDAIFRFAEDHGIERLCINVEETEGINKSSVHSGVLDAKSAEDFFRRAMAAATRPGANLGIREISNMLNYLQRSAYGAIENHLTEPFRTISVDVDGNWSTFCPELMSYGPKRFNGFKFGNLAESPISEQLEDVNLLEAYREISQGVSICRSECEYFDVCGGGRPSNKFGEFGRFDVGETSDCNLTVKALAAACINGIAQLL
jgi:uncharacterized protein